MEQRRIRGRETSEREIVHVSARVVTADFPFQGTTTFFYIFYEIWMMREVPPPLTTHVSNSKVVLSNLAHANT
jgi:hypothetical protein